MERFVQLFVLFTLLWVVIGVIAAGYTQTMCLRHGYADSRLSFTYDAYCVSYVYGAPVTVPFSEAIDEGD